MWVLEGNSEMPGTVHYLPCNTSLKVTRAKQAGHVLLLNDKSISREHATLFVLHESENLNIPSRVPQLVVTDMSSKYGTYINDNIENKERINTQVPVPLNNKDRISFGILSNIWQVKYSPFIVTSSQVSDTSALGDAILSLGGHLVSNWTPECSLLVMNEIILTIKTVSAMASCKHIVTPSYVLSLKAAIQNRESHPNHAEFLPVVKEISISAERVCFAPNERRRSLFDGKTFLFCSERCLRKMKTPISLAGGSALLLTEATCRMILQKGVVVVKPPEDNTGIIPPILSKTLDILKHNGLYHIPESDIGLAILYVSTEEYCNRTFNTRQLLRPLEYSSQALQSLKIYATETQEEETQIFSVAPSRSIVPESGQSKKLSGQKPGSTHSTGNPSVPTLTSLQPHSNGLDTSFSDGSTETLKFSHSLIQKEDKENSIKRKREKSGSDEDVPSTHKKQTLVVDKERALRVNVLPAKPSQDTECVEFDPKFCSTPANDVRLSQHKDPQVPTTSRPTNVADQRMLSPPKERRSLRTGAMLERSTLSIPFEPYTLPSLKSEAVSQSMEENFDSSSQSRLLHLQELDSDASVTSVGGDKWFVKRELPSPEESRDKKKRKEAETSAVPIKRSLSPEPEFAVPAVPPIRPTTKQAEDSIPQRVEKASSSSASQNSEFALPVAFTSRRRASKRAAPASDVLHPPQAIKRSLSVIANEAAARENLPQPDESKTSSTEAEPFIPTNVVVKGEPSSADDVADLAKAIDKSLVVVEVTCLVKKSMPPSARSCSSSPSSTRLNFKKFRKSPHGTKSLDGQASTREVSVLPRILGGGDLFVHAETSNRIEEFMCSQPGLNKVFEVLEHERANRDVVDVADREFNLPMPGATRRVRGR